MLDGASREEAAKIGGMDRQTLRDWVIRFNEQGPDGLINVPSPGAPGKLNDEHKTFLARIVEEGPMPAVHGVVRWRACDLIMRLYEEFGLWWLGGKSVASVRFGKRYPAAADFVKSSTWTVVNPSGATISPPPSSRPSLAIAASISAVSRTGAAVTSTAIDRGTVSNERR